MQAINRKSRAKRLITTLLLGLFFMAHFTAQGQSVEDNAQASDESNGDAALVDPELVLEDVELAEVDSTDEEETTERFIPTEQISQDLGVSFPVDI